MKPTTLNDFVGAGGWQIAVYQPSAGHQCVKTAQIHLAQKTEEP
jgi:hypothetical protein